MFPTDPVLLVDDEEHLVRSFDNTLRNSGINNTIRCSDSREVEPLIGSRCVEAVVLDLTMPYVSGRDLLLLCMRVCPETPVIIVTGASEVDTAVDSMKAGAFDYLVKPVKGERLVTAVMRAVDMREIRRENARLKHYFLARDIECPEAFADIVTADPSMHSIFRYVTAIAVSTECVLITGETGTGKELIAEAIHRLSGRKGKFVPVNVSGLDDTMFSDTLFGHVRGAYTGATADRSGLIEQASGGTLLLDEIADLEASAQVKLLRLLQDREYLPLGSDIPRQTDARIVVATNLDIADLLKSRKFREDLYYRIVTHHVHIPPLRDRKRDLPLLLDHFIQKSAETLGKPKSTSPRELLRLLGTYHFPGNVRQLESMVHDAVSSHGTGVLSMEAFMSHMDKDAVGMKTEDARDDEPRMPGIAFSSDRLPEVDEAVDLLIDEAMRRTSGNQTTAARLLGISRQTLNRRLHLRKEQEAK